MSCPGFGGGGGGGGAEFYVQQRHMIFGCPSHLAEMPAFCLPFLSIWAPLMMMALPTDKKNNSTVFLLLNVAFGKRKVK